MSAHPVPVLTYDVSGWPEAVQVMDRAFVEPPHDLYRRKKGQVRWRPLHTEGARQFGGRQPFFHSDTQHAACYAPPDTDHADALEALRNRPIGCVMPIRQAGQIEWGTNFTHFTYKWPARILECVAFAREALDSPSARKQHHLFYYPPGTHREWHTNEGSPHVGWRAYLVKCAQPGRAHFNYMHGDRLVQDPDGAYTLRIFRFGGGLRFYHCVVSETQRWSFGIGPRDWTFTSLEQARDMLEQRIVPRGARLLLPSD